MLTDKELERYSRQIMVNGIGETGQEKLKQGKVIIAGSGGLGSAASIYLAVAGLGTIRIIDHDRVELGNLNRQVLHWETDIGRSKVDSVFEKLSQINPEITIEPVDTLITEYNVSHLIAGYDLIIDAMDNFPSRYLLNKTALEHNIPLIHGAVYGFEGRVMTIIPDKTACLGCVYHEIAPEDAVPVIGVTPAVIGCIQATEAIKYIVGIGKLLTDRLLIYDGLNMRFAELKVKKDKNCKYCGHSTKNN